MNRRQARWGLGVIAVVAAVELVASARAYRSRIEDQHWDRVSEAIDALGPNIPVFVADGWLGPSARHHLPAVRGYGSAAPPDLRGIPRFAVLGLDGRAWSPELETDLEDLAPPDLEDTAEFGPLTLTTYTQAAAGTVTADFTAKGTPLTAGTDAGACQRGTPWRCKDGTIALVPIEVDHRPRRCFAIDTPDGGRTTINYLRMRTGNMLRGHVGFDDFNRRLRSDAPVSLTIEVDDRIVGDFTFTDAQGWTPFAVAVTPGKHDVSVSLVSAAQGTWDAKGRYDPRVPHRPCIELRSFREGGEDTP